MDKLKEIALKYKSLTSSVYSIYLGYKTNLVNLTITISPDEFFHLAGLHKLKDITYSSKNTSEIFESILNDKLTYDTISKSHYFDEIKDRLLDLENMEHYFDNSTIVVGWDTRMAVKNRINSRVNADYLMKNKSLYNENTSSYIFLKIDSIDKQSNRINLVPTVIENVVPTSFFNTERDYTGMQKKYTLLYKEKIVGDKSEVLYQHRNFTPDNA